MSALAKTPSIATLTQGPMTRLSIIPENDRRSIVRKAIFESRLINIEGEIKQRISMSS